MSLKGCLSHKADDVRSQIDERRARLNNVESEYTEGATGVARPLLTLRRGCFPGAI